MTEFERRLLEVLEGIARDIKIIAVSHNSETNINNKIEKLSFRIQELEKSTSTLQP